uniref:Secreted protein n=1 Tax=Opuntia streptacantha TaxID=393608 RepID=A0A7C8YGM4_OPUST
MIFLGIQLCISFFSCFFNAHPGCRLKSHFLQRKDQFDTGLSHSSQKYPRFHVFNSSCWWRLSSNFSISFGCREGRTISLFGKQQSSKHKNSLTKEQPGAQSICIRIL